MTFVVLGSPATKGSTVSWLGAHGQVVTTADCKGLVAWTRAVAWAAKFAHVSLAPIGTAVSITATFQFLRPKRQRNRLYPTVRPDVDKNTRALLDSLIGVAFVDDAQVVDLHVRKTYGADVRTTIQVERL